MNWIMTFKKRYCKNCKPEPKFKDLIQCHKEAETRNGKLSNLTINYENCPIKKVICHKKCMEIIQNKTQPCLKNIHTLCANKTISAVKVIRLTNDMMVDILQKDPSIKVVYYVRDPRAVFVSRKQAGKWMHSGVSRRNWMTEIKLLCKRMLEDYQNFQKLKFLYPNNVLAMTYEDFAQKPLEHAKNVYKLIGLHLPDEVVKWLKTNTMATKDAGKFDTTRKNSTATAFAWKTKITPDQMYLINSQCENVLNIFGYPLDPVT